MSSDPQQPTDSRQYRRQTERHLLVGVLFMLVVVGSAMIGLLFGWRNALTALMCLLPGALLIILLWFLLRAIEHLVRDRDA